MDSLLLNRSEANQRPSHKQAHEPIDVEFTGWMPVNQRFGHCGAHPQFAHIHEAPSGYKFVQARQVDVPFWQPIYDPEPEPAWRKATLLLGKMLWWPPRKLVSVVANCARHGPLRVLFTLAAGFRFIVYLLTHGAGVGPALRFVLSRHFSSQAMLPRRPKLLFLTSVPYTYNHHPWVIEIEDPTTLFFPFISNGETARLHLESSRFFPVVKALLEAPNCRGIITHMRATAEALPRMFRSDIVASKVSHVPLGVALPAAWQTHDEDDIVHLLFSCSWHQNPDSFYLRGGLEVLEAFEILRERYPHVRLTLRTRLPRFGARYYHLIERCWIRVIGRYLNDEEMDELMRSAHIFLVPAARIHSVSVLKAMAYGQVVVASDGWGFEEYVEHERNGLIVPGRRGKTSWIDPDNGMLREDYTHTRRADPEIVEGLVQTLSTLVEDHGLRRRLGHQARQDVRERFSMENWNRGLKQALDLACLVPSPLAGEG